MRPLVLLLVLVSQSLAQSSLYTDFMLHDGDPESQSLCIKVSPAPPTCLRLLILQI